MTLDEARQYLDTQFIYQNPTPLETMNCPVAKWLTEVDGVTLLGTNDPYEAIAEKQLK